MNSTTAGMANLGVARDKKNAPAIGEVSLYVDGSHRPLKIRTDGNHCLVCEHWSIGVFFGVLGLL